LAKYGIKVRDFAYESTLPPINPVYFLPKQIQPDPGVLRPSQGPAPQPSSSSGVTKQIEKPPAELSIQLPGFVRQRGFFDLRDYDADNDDLPDSQSSSCMLLQPPPSYSQESDEYVKTPIVTPNGSLQWQDVDSTPFQLDNCPPLRPLSFSQARTPTQGELGNKETTSTTPSPLSSSHSSFCISPSPVSTSLPKCRLRRRSSHTTRARQSHLGKDSTPTTVATSPASRYYLRKRRNSPTASSTSKPATRSRLGLGAVSPFPKPSQSTTSPLPSARRQEGASNPPSSQTFRKRPTTSSPTMKRSRKRL
jgi:hypothetical protein